MPRDYCNWETFSAHCESGEVVMMSRARYGRMRLGRCIPETYDRQGNPSLTNCSEDILRYISDLCLDILREFCNWETFSTACKPGEIVLMTSAKYGRMRFGRCVRKMFDDSGRQAVVGCLEIMLKLDVLKIYWSKASLFRFYQRVLQLGDFQCTVQGRWGGSNDQGRIREDEVWQMHQENLRWNLNSDWHRLLWEYYEVSLFLHRFYQRILQLGDFQRTMQTRSGYSDDQRKVWKNEVWKMHKEDHGRIYQGIARCWLLRRYH